MRWKRSWPPDWAKGKSSEFVQPDEVHSSQMLSKPALTSVAGLVSRQLTRSAKAATGPGSDAAPGDGDGQMGLASAEIMLAEREELGANSSFGRLESGPGEREGCREHVLPGPTIVSNRVSACGILRLTRS